METSNFVIVGENIHATRSLKLNGKRITHTDEGNQFINYLDKSNTPQLMQIPEWFKKTQPYSQGQIKHFMIAIMNLREADLNIRLEGEKYIQTEDAIKCLCCGNVFTCSKDHVPGTKIFFDSSKYRFFKLRNN